MGKFSPTVYVPCSPNGERGLLTSLTGANLGLMSPVLVNLRPGERLFVGTKAVAAISNGLHFRTVFDPGLMSFLQSQLFYTVLEGEGSCILAGENAFVMASEAEPAARVGQQPQPRGAPPERIVALDGNGTYRCNAQADWKSVYFEPFTLETVDGSTMVTQRNLSAGLARGLSLLKRVVFLILPI